MEHFLNDPEDKCYVRTIEEYYRIKDQLIQRKLEEYSKKLHGGNNVVVLKRVGKS